jgi:signal transduction histidine kinase
MCLPRRPSRRTIRFRLTLLYGSLFLLSGAALLVITYLLVAHRLPPTVVHIGGSPDGSVTSAAQAQWELAGSMAARQRAATLRLLLIESGIALATMTVASLALGWLVAGRVLRPLRTIVATTRRISADNLHHRLALTGADDELKNLGDTIDELLSRLDASFTAQRQFVANASHELRTPLARQRTLLEVALADPEPTVAAMQATCRKVLRAGTQQERLIEALLTLARSERGLDRREPVDLRAVTEDVIATRAVGATVSVRANLRPAAVLGDLSLAERLVTNLVDNALRHNRVAGHVDVVTETVDRKTILRVTNTGPVVPADDIERLFQPFQRLTGGRHASSDGLGLGLPIAAAIATAHGAHLRAWPRPTGGLVAEVTFAALDPRPPGPTIRTAQGGPTVAVK